VLYDQLETFISAKSFFKVSLCFMPNWKREKKKSAKFFYKVSLCYMPNWKRDFYYTFGSLPKVADLDTPDDDGAVSLAWGKLCAREVRKLR
jgi:hypothetical protein